MMVATRSCRGAAGSVSAGRSPRRSAVRRSTAAHNPSMSPNWYLTAPHVAPMSLAIRFADAAPGPPAASDRNAPSSIASRVAWPRRFGRRPVVVASGTSGSYTPDLDFHRTYCDSWRMAKPPLSMKPTGWFQVAWSAEIGVGDVHRMKYFNRDLIAWRAQSGRLTVMDAYCEHLGAHLGYGGHVVGEVLQCPFHGWQWNNEGRNVCIPYQDRPNRGRRIRTFPVVERNESVYIWHDVDGREPYFVVPDVFSSFDDTSGAADYYPQQRLFRASLEMHPQYVLENGVDFAHFKFVHATPIVPVFTRHDFAAPISYVDFTITFEGSDQQSIDDVRSGVEAINGGLGIAVTKS